VDHIVLAPLSQGLSLDLPPATAQSTTADTLKTVPATSAAAAVMPSNDTAESGPIEVTDVIAKAIIKRAKHLIVGVLFTADAMGGRRDKARILQSVITDAAAHIVGAGGKHPNPLCPESRSILPPLQ
jgi:hypothetical protein